MNELSRRVAASWAAQGLRPAAPATGEEIAAWEARHAALDAEAVRAAGRMRFHSATVDGRPVAVWVAFPVTFAAPPRTLWQGSSAGKGDANGCARKMWIGVDRGLQDGGGLAILSRANERDLNPPTR